MKLELCTQAVVFEALAAEWNDLLQRSRSNLIFLTREWQETWWMTYRPGELHVLTLRATTGELIAIAPWFIASNDDERVLRTIGCVDVTDYLDVIIDTRYEPEVFALLAEHLAEAGNAFDRVNLCNIPAGASILQQWPPLLKQRGFTVCIEPQEVCPVITLPSNWEDYLNQLNKKQRHELRRKLRRVGEQAQWYMVNPEHDLALELEAFLHLMALSSPDKAAFLEDPANVAFFRAIVPRLQTAGWLQLSFLTFDGERAATYLNFDYANRILVYNSGQDVARFGAMSAGIVLLAHTIRHAIETGRSEFDFLRGNETYKYQMGGQDTEVFKLKATRA